MKDLATRRMRVGYEHTLERAFWSACILVAAAAAFLGGMFVQATYLTPPPIVYHTPAVRVEPSAAYLSGNCIELARTCYARKRSAHTK